MTPNTELLDRLPVAVYTTDAEGRITYFNEAAAEFWGHRPEVGTDKWCGSWKLYWPDGEVLPHDECPMAVTLRTGVEVRGARAVAERPDGTRISFRPYPTLLRDSETGAITGAMNLLMDLGPSLDAEATAARLAAIVESSDDAIISKTLDGKITSWNAAATRILGYTPEEMIGQSILKIIPDDLQDEEKHIIARIRQGDRIEHFDTVRVTKSGRKINLSLTVSPLKDGTGRVTGASKVARDISERKSNEELQRLLFNELNHRVKNTLATIQAIAGQSLRRASSPSQFVESFNGRVQSLARAHDLLVQTQMVGADLQSILREQVLLGGAESSKIRLTGPGVILDARAAVQLGMVLHELATNARKYGALASESGFLSVEWSVSSGTPGILSLEWRESGLSNVRVPTQHGFGTVLIERSLQSNGGSAEMEYRKDGITCRIVLPVAELAPLMGERQAATYRQPHTPAAALNGVRVLLVEDEPLVAMDVEAILTDQGCEIVGVATSVQSAGVLIDQGGFDVVLLDCNLMGQPVGALAQRLRDLAKPFAFATGYGAAGLPDGFESVSILAKPYRAEELIGVVAALTGGATAARLLTPAGLTQSADYRSSSEIGGGEPRGI